MREIIFNYFDFNHGTRDVNMIRLTSDAGTVIIAERILHLVSPTKSGRALPGIQAQLRIKYQVPWLVREQDLNYISPSNK